MASSTNNEKIDEERPTVMYEGKNIHSSPVDGKLLCSFSEKTCMQRRLNHYAFCIRHVLEDKNAPFKQCKFVAKYNGQRCTNAIPFKEDRIYCNSHLQVLGLVPKKSRKKKVTEHSVNTAKHIAKSSTAERFLPVHHVSQNSSSKRNERLAGCSESVKTSPKRRVSRKAKLLSSNPLLCQLVSTYSQANSQKRNLLPFYGVCSSDENDTDDDDDGDSQVIKQFQTSTSGSNVECSTTTHSASGKQNLRAAKLQNLREKLHAELMNVKKNISSHRKDVKQSEQALGLLVASVKTSPALTTAAIHENCLLGSRKRSAPTRHNSIPCTAKTPEKCVRTAIPYTKYCYQHILKDGKQQLFHQCAADISPTSKCSRTTLNLLYEKPLCREHSAGKEAACHPTAPPLQPIIPPVPLAVQKPPAKKAKRKPQAKASPTQKPTKSSRKTTKRESSKTTKPERGKKGASVVAGQSKVKQEVVLDRTPNHLNFDKSLFPTEGVEVEERQPTLIYPLNGTIKLEELASPKNDMFDSDSFKDQEMFGESEMDVDDSLENDDLSEDLGDISPTGMLRETVLKLPPESPEPTSGTHLLIKQPRVSPVEAFSINERGVHKPILSNSRIELPRKADLCANDIPSTVNHGSVIPGLRPSRTTVITLPKYPSSTISHIPLLTRHIPSAANTDYTAFKPIGPAIIKSEVGARKVEPRPIDVHHGLPLFPLSFDPVLTSPGAWGGGGKLLVNNRARPMLISSQLNPMTFSPPSLSPHVSPQITLGTAFNFDRPTVLQHSNSPSPTLSPFGVHLPNSPHGKLVPRTSRLESRGNSNSNEMHDPFFGASFDKP